MEESEGIVLSPDGTQLYVAAATVGVVGTVSHFRLDANGSPTWANCVGTVTVPGCAPSSPNAALIGARDLVVSADGRHLYVAADGNANAQQGSVSHFTLDANGDPTFAGCLGGAVGCATPTIAGAMTYPSSLALSADGARLYVGANTAVSSLSLDATGGMTFDGCLGGTGCANAAPPTAFSGVWGLELGADGRRLFATSFGSDSVSWLPLDASSLPTFGGCIGMAAACTATTPAQALGGAYDLAPTPDGRRLFVTAYNAQLLDSFDIEQPPGPPRTGPGPGPPADTAPRLTRYKLSRAKFAAAAKGRSVAAAKRPRIKVGTTVRYTLSEVATVTFTVERRSAGRKVKGRCVAARKRNRGRPSCKRYVAVRGSFRSKAARGANRLGFTGRLRARKLPPGSYRLVATARDAAGSKSAARRVRFTIVAG
jgi:DNA-binding beta-propeller fold protein YncE